MLTVMKCSLESGFGTTPRINGTSGGRSTRRSSLPIFENPSELIFRTHNYLTGEIPSLSERCPASLNYWPRQRKELPTVCFYQLQLRTRAVLVKAVFKHS